MPLPVLWHSVGSASFYVFCSRLRPPFLSKVWVMATGSVLWQVDFHALPVICGRLHVISNISYSMVLLSIVWHDLVPKAAQMSLGGWPWARCRALPYLFAPLCTQALPLRAQQEGFLVMSPMGPVPGSLVNMIAPSSPSCVGGTREHGGGL